MKKLFYAFVLAGAALFVSCGGELTPDADATKLWVAGEDGTDLLGYIDASGKMVINANFSKAYGFSCGWAAVVEDGEVKFIDKGGKKGKLPSVDGYSQYFYYNRLNFRDDKLYGKFDNSFNKVVKAKYSSLGMTGDNGYAFFCKDGDDKYGYIDADGDVVIEDQFDYASTFVKGICIAGEANNEGKMRYGIINTKGDYVYDLSTKMLMNLGEGRVACYNVEGTKCTMIDKNGNEYGDSYEEIDPFSCGLALVEKNDKCGYIDTKGNEVIELGYEVATDFSDNVAWVSRKGGADMRFILIDKKGNELIDLNKSQTPSSLFHNGLCLVYNAEKNTYIYINKKGDEVYSWKVKLASPAPSRNSIREMSIREMAGSENAALFMERLHGLRLLPNGEVEYVH